MLQGCLQCLENEPRIRGKLFNDEPWLPLEHPLSSQESETPGVGSPRVSAQLGLMDWCHQCTPVAAVTPVAELDLPVYGVAVATNSLSTEVSGGSHHLLNSNWVPPIPESFLPILESLMEIYFFFLDMTGGYIFCNIDYRQNDNQHVNIIDKSNGV